MEYALMSEPRRESQNRIWELISTIAAVGCSSPAIACQMVRNSRIRENDLVPWARYRHSVDDSYGRNLVYAQNGLEVMIATWDRGDYSAIHNHGHTQWGVVQVFGRIEHAVFGYRNGKFTAVSRDLMPANSIIGVTNALYHQMGSMQADTFLTLHIYGTESDTANVTGGAEVYDLYQRKVYKTDGGVFYNRDRVEEKFDRLSPRVELADELRDCVNLCNRELTVYSASKLRCSRNRLNELAERLYRSNRFEKVSSELNGFRGFAKTNRPTDELLLALSATADNQRDLIQHGVLPKFNDSPQKQPYGDLIIAQGDGIFQVWCSMRYSRFADRLTTAGCVSVALLPVAPAFWRQKAPDIKFWSLQLI